MTLPNTIIGGTVAAGTSFLSSVLERHPDVFVPQPLRPEPNFFVKTWEHEKGLDYYQNKYFAKANGEQVIVDRSSLCLSEFNGQKIAERIHRALPDVKLIFMLRDPTARAWANYRFTVLSGLEPLSFERALEREEERMKVTDPVWREIQPHAYFARGLYARQLRPYLDLFPPEQLLILSSDRVRLDPDAATTEICGFLGIGPPPAEEEAGVFTSPNVRSRRLQVLLRRSNGQALDQSVERVRERRSPISLLDRLVVLNLTSRKEELDDRTRDELRARYAPHNRELQSLVPWSVEEWGT